MDLLFICSPKEPLHLDQYPFFFAGWINIHIACNVSLESQPWKLQSQFLRDIVGRNIVDVPNLEVEVNQQTILLMHNQGILRKILGLPLPTSRFWH